MNWNFKSQTRIRRTPACWESLYWREAFCCIEPQTATLYLEGTDTISCHLYQSSVRILPKVAKSHKQLNYFRNFFIVASKPTETDYIEHFPKNIKIWKPVFWAHSWDFLNEHHINMHLDTSFYMYPVVIFGLFE